jgi:hypothetical protein
LSHLQALYQQRLGLLQVLRYEYFDMARLTPTVALHKFNELLYLYDLLAFFPFNAQ